MKQSPIESPSHVHKVELLISAILRVGVVLSLLIIVCGMVLSLKHHPGYFDNPSLMKQITTPGRIVPHTLGEVFRGAILLKGEPLIAAGLLLLIATPVLRVAVSIFIFLFEKDWWFVVTTGFVLGMLILSFFLGRVE